ncbi:MAG: glycosyltransferase [Cyclobacteriaceae bacterium]
MDWFVLFIVVGSGYLIFFIIVSLGIALSKKPKKATSLPTVSILVACKNEEIDLERCLYSLEALKYPEHLVEVILIDDESTDATPEIIAQAVQRNPNFVSFHTKASKPTHLKAKARAIDFGANQAKNEWLFIVDADAKLHPDWISHMVHGIDDKTGMIGGLILTEEDSYFSLASIEKVALLYTQPMIAGMFSYGVPPICSGPNMAIRRDVYEAFGGLKNVDFKVAEDQALTRIVLKSGYRIQFHLSAQTMALLKTVPSVAHFISQQRRWLLGGFEREFAVWGPLVFAFAYHFILSLILLFGWLITVKGTLICLFMVLISDFVYLAVTKWKLRTSNLLRFWPLMSLYATIAFIWMPLSVIASRKIRWKGVGYEVKY